MIFLYYSSPKQGVSFFCFDTLHISEIVVKEAVISGSVIKIKIVVREYIEIIKEIARSLSVVHPKAHFCFFRNQIRYNLMEA